MTEHEKLDPVRISQMQYQYGNLLAKLTEVSGKVQEIDGMLRAHKEEAMKTMYAHNQAINEVKTKQYYQGTGLEKIDTALKVIVTSIASARDEAASALSTFRSNDLKEVQVELRSKASAQQVQTLENVDIDNLKKVVQDLTIFQQKSIAILSLVTLLMPIALTLLINYIKKV